MASKSGKKTGIELEFSLLEEKFTSSVKEVNSSLSSMKKELTLQNEVLKNSNATLEDYEKKLSILNNEHDLATQKVSETERMLEESVRIFGENSKETTKWQNALLSARTEQQKIQNQIDLTTREIDNYSNKLQENSKENENLNSSLKALNSTIDSQKKDLENLKSQYSNIVLEKGKTSKEAKNLKKEINNLSSELKSNETRLEDSTKDLNDFSEKEKDASTNSISLGNIIKGNLISDAIKAGLKGLANSIGDVANSMKECITSGAAWADDINTLSTQTGISTEKLQQYDAISNLVDVSTDTLTSSMAKNIKQMSAGSAVYDKLGVSIYDANGKLRDSDEVYWESIDALGKISNETERDALAMSLFGKSAQDLNPLISLGSEGINELTKKTEQMGVVLSEDALNGLQDLNNELDIFSATTKATSNIVASAFAPALSEMMEDVNGIAGEFNGLISAIIGGNEEEIDKASEEFSKSIDSFVESISNNAPKLIEMGGRLILNLANALVENLPKIIDVGMNVLTKLLEGITSNLPSILPVIVQAIMTIVNSIIANLPTIIQAGIQIIIALLQGIADSLPTLVPTIVQSVILIVETLLDNIDLIIDAGIDIIFGLVDGLITALPDLIDKIPEIIDKLITAITNNLPKIVEAGITLIIKLAEGLIKAIPQLISKVPQIITSLVKGFSNLASKMGEVGLNLVKGIWNGISNAKDWILNKIKGFKDAILDGIKNFFGIHSPSTIMEHEIGENLGLGVGVGFANSMPEVEKNILDSMSYLTDNISSEINPVLNPTISSVTEQNVNPGTVSPIYLTIENFYNNREQDIEELSEEMAFYNMKASYGKGV